MEDFFSYIFSQGKPRTIVILSPDHFQSGILMESNSFITIALDSNEKEFNNLKIDTLLWGKLSKNNKMILNNSAVIAEHGVTVLLPYIKKYFPETNILPILIPADITKEQIEQLVEMVN